MELKDFEEKVNKFKELQQDLKNRYVELGGLLIDINHPKYICSIDNFPKGRECKNIYEVAELKFNLCKSTTKNLIGICKRFGECKSTLKKEYQQYNYTQLSEMLPLSDEQIKLVNVGMSKQDIRALRKVIKESGQPAGQNIETQEISDIAEFITLKNDTERQKFIQDYQSWGVWLIVPQLNLKFYRCNLNNGAYLLISEVEYQNHYDNDKLGFSHMLRIIDQKLKSPYEYFQFDGISGTEYCDYMKRTKCKIVNPASCLLSPKPIDINKYKKEIVKANIAHDNRKLTRLNKITKINNDIKVV